jgi:hypothetical protein
VWGEAHPLGYIIVILLLESIEQSFSPSNSYKAMTTAVCYVLLIVRKQHFTCFSPVSSV